MFHLLGWVGSGRLKCAVHIRHSNRDDAVDEQGWVEWMCHRLGCPLYTHWVQLVRPRGEGGCLTRQEYEDWCKEIRFNAYRGAWLAQGGEGRPRVVIGHHLDDLDENRLAELGKGNYFDIDGMSSEGEGLGVTVLRPLCHSTRKSELVAFALRHRVPYMVDSTPRWSRRGWIRRIIDSCADVPQLQALLQEAGQLSASVSREIRGEVAMVKRD
jgi:tRNA(Ile)-lysidine synthase TilS/MesJ